MNQDILTRFARRLRWATVAAAAVLLVAVGSALLLDSSVVTVGAPGLPRGWRMATSAVVIVLAVGSLASLGAMLRAIERGRLFVRSTTRHFRRFALLYLLSVLFDVLLPPLVQLAAVLVHGGHGDVMVAIDDGRLLALVVAALLFFIARLFDEARRLDEDSRAFV